MKQLLYVINIIDTKIILFVKIVFDQVGLIFSLPRSFTSKKKRNLSYNFRVDFFSNIGGLLGLCLGMGFISFIELVWLSLRIGAQAFGLKDWI